jgi:hypothetical protein
LNGPFKGASWNGPDGKRVLDLIADGGFTVMPPSQHPDTGQPYVWTGPDALEDVDPSDLPELRADIIERLDAALAPLGCTRGKAAAAADPAPERREHVCSDPTAPERREHVCSDPWRRLNEQALARLADWVLALGLYKCRPARGGFEAVPVWRPSNEGNSLEKRKLNLHLHPIGITDDGASPKGMTAIDVIMKAKSCDAGAAFAWLDDRLNPSNAVIAIKPKAPKAPRNPGVKYTMNAWAGFIDSLPGPYREYTSPRTGEVFEINRMTLEQCDRLSKDLNEEGGLFRNVWHDVQAGKHLEVPPPDNDDDDQEYELEDAEIDWDEKGELSDLELKELRIKAKAERTALLKEFNAKYMVVCEGGQALVYHLTYNEILGRKFYESMKLGSLQQLYANRKVTSSVTKQGEHKKRLVVPFWNAHQDRRQYIEGVEFDPSRIGHRPGYLNLWQGFGVEERAGGSWVKLRAHMQDNICAGNAKNFEWLMDWCARLVQYPQLQGEVAVVLRGKKGTGKGNLGHALRKLLSHHGIHISTSAHLVGKFNEHLRDCVFLFADEAFFAGDKQGESALKSLITESVLLIEGKFKTAQQYPNRLHVLMASNSDWVVPAGPNERRYFVLDVSDEHMQDYDYFAAIDDELKSGGYEAMLHELRHRDISKFNHRQAPDTGALQDQKLQSLPTELAWWQTVLQREYVHESEHGLEDEFGCWHEWMATDLLFKSYNRFAKARGERHPKNSVHFGRFMNDMGGQPYRPRTGVVGERLQPEIGRVPETIERDRPQGYRLGTLEYAREVFETKTGIKTDYGKVEDDD